MGAHSHAFRVLVGRKRCNGVHRCGNHECCNPAHAKNFDEAGFAARRRKVLVDNQRKHLYGIAPEEIAAKIGRQGGRCAICRRSFVEGDGSRRNNVDHCHISKVNRDLLCQSCNTGLGKFQDSTDLLSRAIAYLCRHNVEAEGE